MFRRGLAVLAGGLVAFGTYLLIDPQPSPPPARPASLASPDSAGVSNVGLPAASPAPMSLVDPTPVRLVIASIGVDAAIERRGLDPNRNLATPADYRDVAWYDRGPRPGESGDAILNGHVDWWTGDAVFTHLGRLHAGDPITVVRADGTSVGFKVSSLRTVDANARLGSLFTTSGPATLTLITCTGVWNPATQSDTQRLLVTAQLA